MKKFHEFINEGKREEAKMNELLEIIKKSKLGGRKLTEEEHDLLVSLSKGESLPDESSTLKMHKTGGGYLYDDEGNVLTEEEPEINPGKEFVTAKGKSRSSDKFDVEDIIEARVYRNKNSEERFIYSYMTIETDNGITNDWIIYRTNGGKEFGMILDTNLDRFKYYKQTIPDVLWKELDFKFDYGMILDQDLYQDFINFIELFKENKARNKEILKRLYMRFCTLL